MKTRISDGNSKVGRIPNTEQTENVRASGMDVPINTVDASNVSVDG